MTNEPCLGAHLVSPRRGYSHHGIYVGSSKVIHYSGFSTGLSSGPVEEVHIDTFSDNKGFTIRSHVAKFSGKEIVNRARSRLGQDAYNVFNNNCEHFCLWCVTGQHDSRQVDFSAVTVSPGVITTSGLAGKELIRISGSVSGLSGSGVMNGLASIGKLVRGGAVAGVFIVGSGGGLIVTYAMNNSVLADNIGLDFAEREARSVGRGAGYAGTFLGAAGSVASISVAGTVSGLSAAGITSGLAAIGAAFGGGMATGLTVALAAPAAAALAVGYGSYKIFRWFKD